MRHSVFLLFFLAFVGWVHQPAAGQAAVVAEITRLEEMEREAILKSDTATLHRLWGKDFVVHNPQNRVVTSRQAMARLRDGRIDYASFERTIEKITISGNVAVTMGQEILKPANKAENAGKTVTRRYTNVWMRTAGTWQMLARQATIIQVQ
ncbi:MAG: hypothetical protein JWR44_1698 [Hymenobacter sp.]|jgi:ketosteroid isomerase-like protein|nr:hypothetical protein [Hymenobacter sp.]